MGAWSRFWTWYEDKILGSIVIIAIIQFIQIPHMIWNADLYLELGTVSRIHPAIDWLLYGVDLIEIVSIINVGMIMYSLIKRKRRMRNSKHEQLGSIEQVRTHTASETCVHESPCEGECSQYTHRMHPADGNKITNALLHDKGEQAGMKQVIIVRTDLGMGKGKIAAQVGHACVIGALRVKSVHPDWFEEWQPYQAKIVLRADSLDELESVRQQAATEGLPCSRVLDAGHTQLEPGTVTCVSIGPAPDGKLDRVTGNLKLL